MIIYGSKAIHLKTAQSRRATCESCETKGSIVFSAFSRHAHIFWIPLFPIGKRGVSECQHCKNVLKPKQMSNDLKQEYINFKSDVKTPSWQYSGLFLIALLILWGMYDNEVQTKKEQAYLADPKIGDVYEFKTDSRNYSTFKIIEIHIDSLYVSYNEYEIDKIGNVDEIDIEKNYQADMYSISRQQLKEMYASKEVYDINRK